MSLTHTWQLKAARSITGLSQAALANACGASLPTIKRLELGDGVLGIRLDTLGKIRRTLEAAGVDFIAENGGGPGVRAIKGYPERAIFSDDGVTFAWPRRLGEGPDAEASTEVRISQATLSEIGLPIDSLGAMEAAFRLSARFIIERVAAHASKRVVAGSVRLQRGDLRRDAATLHADGIAFAKLRKLSAKELQSRYDELGDKLAELSQKRPRNAAKEGEIRELLNDLS